MADNAQSPEPMAMFGESELGALRAFVGGYLHQDFVAEHKTPTAALEAYCREAGRREVLDLESDLDRFMQKTSRINFAGAREIFVRELNSGWIPPNRAALVHLTRMVRAQLLKK